MFVFISGLIASIVHVLSGPDHLAAVMPLAVEQKSRAWRTGLMWGLGHTSGMLLIGFLYLLFRELIPIESISEYSERIVGFVLIGIGLWSLGKIRKKESAHTHHRNKGSFSAFIIGLIHGLAGLSHLFAILPTLALPSKIASFSYLGGFAAGTVAAMILFAFIIGFFASRGIQTKKQAMFKILRFVSALIAIFVGVIWIILSF
jgi:hydrogenase/urease accessory protein HupE